MNENHKLLGFYNYTVVLTYIGMLCGFTGISYAYSGSFGHAVICLMAAGVCDMFDGTIASTRPRTRQEKCFGIQIDSLSDLICFGVLPASIVYNLNDQTTMALVVGAFYTLCALIRLAYFNVDEQERQQASSEPREIYYGLPVTLSALFLPLVYEGVNLFHRESYHVTILCLLTMAIFFLSPIPLKKPKLLGKARDVY